MWFKSIVTIAVLVLGWMLFPGAGIADRIILKDGTVEESDKIWTSDKFVHFILKGTRSVEIRYAIDIVDRVERDFEESRDNSSVTTQPEGQERTPDASRLATSPNSGGATSGSLRSHQGEPTADLRKIELGGKGISFYDPRRPMRYQISKTSAHPDLQSALDELARIYGRTPDWVAAYMGEENDIQIIHHNLIDRRQAEMTSRKATESASALPSKYQTDAPDSAHSGNALESLPSKQISQNPPDDPELKKYKGIKFYDPRRKRKYWTGKTTHHGSLQKALEALASQYNVTPEWIEDHMGESNLLIEIHRSVRSNLLHE